MMLAKLGVGVHFRYQSLQHLSLSEATTLGFLGPIGTGILGYLILKEPFTRREATAGGEMVFPSYQARSC
jgi:drug/metabolite transporter (DMT)-like permease